MTPSSAGLSKHLAGQLSFGLGYGVLVALLLIATDIAGLASRLVDTAAPTLAMVTLCMTTALAFGTLSVIMAVMAMPVRRRR